MRPGQSKPRRGKKPVRFTDPKAEASKTVIATECRLAMGLGRGQPVPYTGPVVMSAVFVFAIPVSWPKKLQEAALRGEVFHVADPDLSQLVKQVEDALVGLVYVDDNQIVGYGKVAKRYGHPERSEIEFASIKQPEVAVTPGQRRLESMAEEADERRIAGRLGR